eukprot:9534117-Alexandrium_andersonii.AAC.1
MSQEGAAKNNSAAWSFCQSGTRGSTKEHKLHGSPTRRRPVLRRGRAPPLPACDPQHREALRN